MNVRICTVDLLLVPLDLPDFNENNIENKTNKALRFLIEDRRRKCDRV
jgi:hypothetical protein